MQSLSGRLEEVVAYKNQTTGRLFQEEVRAHLLYNAICNKIIIAYNF